jgi:hypothetical protein
MSSFNENSINQIIENELTQMFENLTVSNTGAPETPLQPYQSIHRLFNVYNRRIPIDLSNNPAESPTDRNDGDPTDADYFQLLREYNRNIYEYENNIDNLTNLTRTTNLMLNELTNQYNNQLSVYQRNVNFILNGQSPNSVLSNFSDDYNNIMLNYQWNMEHFLDILRQLYLSTSRLTENYTNTIRNYQNNVNRFYARQFNRARNMNENNHTQPSFTPPNTLSQIHRTPRRSIQRRTRLVVPRNRPSLLLNEPPMIGGPSTTVPLGPIGTSLFSTNRQYLDLLNLIFTNNVPRETDELPSRLSRRDIDQATSIIRWNSSMNESHCPITWEDFTEGEEIRQIRHCSHIFKNMALLNWLRTHNICPVCRYDLRTFLNSSSSNNNNDETEENGTAPADPEPIEPSQGDTENDFVDLPDLLAPESNEDNREETRGTANTYETFLDIIRNLTNNENIIPDFTRQDSSGNYVAQYSFEFYPRS